MSTPTGRMPSCARLLLPGSGTSSEEALGSPRSALSRAKTRGIGSFLSSVRMGDRPAPDEAAQHHPKVVVWSATNVCDVGQVADPHVKLHVLHGGALHREVQRTPTVRNNREPEWDAPFLLHAPSLSDASLVLSVYDTDQLSADDLLAYIVLPMSALASDAQLAAAGGGSTTSVFSENSTESPVPEAEPRNFELQLRPSNAQIKRHESMSLFGARSTEPEPIRLRVSACLHRSSRRPMQSGVLPASSHGSTSAPSSGRVGTPVERADSGDFPPRELGKVLRRAPRRRRRRCGDRRRGDRRRLLGEGEGSLGQGEPRRLPPPHLARGGRGDGPGRHSRHLGRPPARRRGRPRGRGDRRGAARLADDAVGVRHLGPVRRRVRVE